MRRPLAPFPLSACAALALAAGAAHAQHSVRDPAGPAAPPARKGPALVTVNPDGHHEMEHVTLPSSEFLRVFGGAAGSTPGSPIDLEHTALPLGTTPEADDHADLDFLPDGSGIVIANRRSNNLVILDPATRAPLANIALSGSPQSLAINPAGTVAVTANHYNGNASVVNLVTGTEVAVIPTGPFPATALITPDGTRALIHNNGRVGTTGPFGTLSVINLATNTVERTITTGATAMSLSLNFEWQGVGMASSGPVVYDNTTVLHPVFAGSATVGSQVLIIDIATGNTTAVNVAGSPRNIEVHGTKAYVIHTGNVRTVTEIDVPSATVSRTFTSAVDLQGPAAVNAAGDRLAVGVQNNFQILDLVAGTFSPNVSPALSNPNALLRTRDGNHVMAVNFFGTIANFNGSVVATFSGPSNYTIGAVSPATDRVAMVSAAFGEDMIVVNTTPGGVAQLSAGPTGPAPEADKPRMVAVNPAGTRAVTANVLSLTASVIDTASETVLATLPIQRRPGNVEITPDGTRAVIASRDGTGVDVIDLATNTVTPVALGVAPVRADGVVFSPDSQFAYVNVITGGDGVFRIDLSNNSVSPKVPTGDMASISANFSMFSGIALSPDGSKLVTCNTFVHTLTFIDTATMTVTATVPVANQPIRAAFSPGGDRLYVTSTSSHTFSVFDTTVSPPALLGTANVGNSPSRFRMNATGTRAYVQATEAASPFRPLIAVVDLTVTPPALVTQHFMPSNPTWSFGAHRVSADGSRLYVSRGTTTYTIGNGGVVVAENGAFTVIDAATGALIEELPTGRLSTYLAKDAADTVFVSTEINVDTASIFSEPAAACYANCDGSTQEPVLNVQDFSCFLTRYAAGESYANCDGSTQPPVLNVQDFSCFLTKYAAGCP